MCDGLKSKPLCNYDTYINIISVNVIHAMSISRALYTKVLSLHLSMEFQNGQKLSQTVMHKKSLTNLPETTVKLVNMMKLSNLSKTIVTCTHKVGCRTMFSGDPRILLMGVLKPSNARARHEIFSPRPPQRLRPLACSLVVHSAPRLR